jgi:hypothetical protein
MIATLLRALIFWIVMALSGYPPGLGDLHFHEAVLAGALNAAVIVVAMIAARRFPVVR